MSSSHWIPRQPAHLRKFGGFAGYVMFGYVLTSWQIFTLGRNDRIYIRPRKCVEPAKLLESVHMKFTFKPMKIWSAFIVFPIPILYPTSDCSVPLAPRSYRAPFYSTPPKNPWSRWMLSWRSSHLSERWLFFLPVYQPPYLLSRLKNTPSRTSYSSVLTVEQRARNISPSQLKTRNTRTSWFTYQKHVGSLRMHCNRVVAS